MNKKFKIVMISDMDATGSGYASITTALGSRLSNLGHEVKILGLSYRGEEHNYNFSLIPCPGIKDAFAMLSNMQVLFKPDVIIGLSDIPNQDPIVKYVSQLKIPYICISPMENGPLCATWAMILAQVDKCYMMSDFAVAECEKMGVPAEHLVIGVDTESWKWPTQEERMKIRESLGIVDEFIILTVADNQERKNLWGAFESLRLFKEKTKRSFRYILVTRENQFIGYRLRDLAQTCNITSELMIFERGLPFKNLWGLFAASDVFLLTSRAEGLGMPVLESMSVGLPVVSINTGAIGEHLQDNRGFLIPPEYDFIDTWGNSRRDMIDADLCSSALINVERGKLPNLEAAHKYVENRNWDKTVQQLLKGIADVAHKD
jgi:glycosyltransferase involved in cell wall biosynthesis